MTVRIFAVAMLLLGLAWRVDAADRCEPQVYADVELRLMSDGRILLPANVHGHDVYFEFRPGSGLAVLVAQAAEPLGLKPKPRVGGATMVVAGKSLTHYVKLEKMKVGEFVFADRLAPLYPQGDADSLETVDGRPLVGVMGSTLIRYVDAEIHLAERRFRLFKPFKCRDRSPAYWGGEVAELPMRFDAASTLVFTMELEGKEVESSLSTSNRSSTVDANATRQFFGFDENSPGITESTLGDGTPGIFHAMSLTGRNLRISDAQIRLDTGRSCELTGRTQGYGDIGYTVCLNGTPFTLGTDLLQRLRIYVSKARQKMYVSVVGTDSPGQATPDIVPYR